MIPLSSRSTRVIALVSFVGAFLLYYQHTKPPDDTVQVQVNDRERLMMLKLSQSDIQSFLQAATNDSGRGHSLAQGKARVSVMSFTHQQSEDETGKEGHSPHVTRKTVVDRICGSEEGAAVWTHPALTPSYGSFLRNLDLSKYRQEILSRCVWMTQDSRIALTSLTCGLPNLLIASVREDLKTIAIMTVRYSGLCHDRQYLESRMDEMLARTRRVGRWCSSHSQLAASTALNLVWHANHTPSVMWCPVYKSAPASWFINLIREGRFNEGNSENLTLAQGDRKKARDRTHREEEDRVFKTSLRVLVVRDPYTRMVSAYLDKIATRNPRPKYFKTLQVKIMKEYRKNRKPEALPYPTFPEFVQYVLDSTRILHTVDQWMEKVHCWRPYWAQCNVCAADYDLILKMETFEEDRKFLITLANMTDLKDDKWPEQHESYSRSQAPDEARYLRQLDRSQLNMFYHQYIIDFELFDYVSLTDLAST